MVRAPTATSLVRTYRRSGTGFAAASVAAAAYGVLVAFWIVGNHSWFHPELFGISEKVWPVDQQLSFAGRCALLFDWKLFDVSPYRLRPLSDLVEILDAACRPDGAAVFGCHPSVTPSALVLAVAAPLFLYWTVRRVGLAPLQAALFLLLLMTSVGFLSSFVAYIRPAKKLAFFLTCLVLWLSFQCQKSTARGWLYPLLGVVFLSFFADETGYALWLAAVILLARWLAVRRDYWSAGLLAGIPVVYVLVVKALVPVIYGRLGTSGPRSEVAAGHVVWRLLGYLAEPRFYEIAFNDMATGTLASLGILDAGSGAIGAFAVFFGAMLALSAGLWVRHRASHVAAIYANVAAMSLVLVAVSFSLTLFDWFNNPFASNYLGALTYYYHNVIPVVAAVWLACVMRLATTVPLGFLGRQLVGSVCATLLLAAAIANVANFQSLNRLFHILHTYPLDTEALRKPALQIDRESKTIQVSAPLAPADLAAEYTALADHVLGTRRPNMVRALEIYQESPIGDAAYVSRYLRLFYPGYRIQVEVQNPAELDRASRQ